MFKTWPFAPWTVLLRLLWFARHPSSFTVLSDDTGLCEVSGTVVLLL